MPEIQFKSTLIKQARIKSNHRVLDFGIGTATLSIMAKRTNPSTLINGVDVDPKVIDIAKKKIVESKADIQIDKYDGVILPYEDDYFDRVISSLVFHHLTTEQKVNSFKEIKRVLKPGGELHIADWGEPANLLMRINFYLVQLLDGFKTTKDNVKGLLPSYMINAGFKEVSGTSYFNTIFGTIRLTKAVKS